MSRERLNTKIFEFLKTQRKVNITPQAIRNAISKIRSDNPGVTLNAAAKIFAEKRGVTIMRYLDTKDRQSLQNVKTSNQPTVQTAKIRKIKVRKVSTTFGSKFINQANQNADSYPYIYILENSLRNLILETFQSEKNWWKKKVNKKVQEYAQRIKGAEKRHDWLPARADQPIYYVGLTELAGIIIRNYSSFKKIITDQNRFKTWIDECAPIRNLIAHNISLRTTERQNLKIRTEYICTMIERNKPTN